MGTSRLNDSSAGGTVSAWLVHALTASGAVIAFLALRAAEQGDWRQTMAWLAAALLVDGVDGPLARWLDVKARTPRIDGATLDLIVDYLTFVFVPTVLIVRMELMPDWFALPAVALIQLSALYHYARNDLKTEDNYYVGFPALWNLVVFYLLLLEPGAGPGALAVVVCAAATFAPINFVHPVRVRDFRPWLPIAASVWAVASIALLWPGWSMATARAWLAASLGGAAFLIAAGLLRTVRGPRGDGAAA